MLILIIILLLTLLLTFILYKIIKSVWKVILLIFLITLIGLGIVGYLVYKDIKNIAQTPKLIILESNEKIQTGYVLSNEYKYAVNSTTLSNINHYYERKDLEKIRDDTYRIIILNARMFDSLPETINIENKTISKSNLMIALNSETKEEFISALGIDKEDIVGEEQITNDSIIKFKATIAGFFLLKLAENPKVLLQQIGSENFRIYPNSITISLLKQAPTSILEEQIEDLSKEIRK